jgi:hypothetical protein
MRVHYLPAGYIWAVCGTPHDRQVTENVTEVTCLNCEATWKFRRDAGGSGLFLRADDTRLKRDPKLAEAFANRYR